MTGAQTAVGAKPQAAFYPALDGLRALAFLSVFSFHYLRAIWHQEIWRWGWIGVDVFFVLSGFLITGILHDSVDRQDYFGNFYIRRALRIFPVFYGFWLVMLVLTSVLQVHWDRPLLAMAAYLGNFFIAGGLIPTHPRPDLLLFKSPFPHGHFHEILLDQFWSLCVEEQFYLVWPAVIWFVRSRTALLRLCVGLLFLLPVGRCAYVFLRPGAAAMLSHGALYFNTLSRCDGLFAGAAVALWMRGQKAREMNTRWVAILLAVGSPALLALLLQAERVRPLSIFDPVVSTIGFTLIAAFAVGVLLLSIGRPSMLTRVLRWAPLIALGRISYGMYFYHNLFFPDVLTTFPWARAHHALPLVPLGVFAATVAVSRLSFRFIESPFLRLKPLLAPKPGAVDDPMPAAHLVTGEVAGGKLAA